MAAKRPSPVSKALAVLFSSLIAPVIVNVTANAIKVDVNPPAAAAARASRIFIGQSVPGGESGSAQITYTPTPREVPPLAEIARPARPLRTGRGNPWNPAHVGTAAA